jgi:hypothetical protein
MTFLVQKRILSRLPKVYYEQELAMRIEQGDAPYQTRIQPQGTDEPLSVRLTGAVRVRTGNQMFSGAAEIVVTRLRLLMLLKPQGKSKGLNARAGEVALVSVDRADLKSPQRITTLTGKVKQVDFAGLADPIVIQVIYTRNFERLLEVMKPEYALQLGQERAAELKDAKRLDQARVLEEAMQREAEDKRIQAARFGDATGQTPAGGSALPVGGLLDHLKTWRYKVAAPPGQCVRGFASAFTGSGGIVLKAKWSVEQTPDGAVARYAGRKGLVGVVTAFSETAQAEQAGAIGTEVRFEIEEQGDGYTICAMWLASRETRLGFTNDARFFKPYMRAVEAQLRQVDPTLKVVKE